MKAGATFGVLAAAAALVFGIYMVDIDQTQEAQLPEISIEGGQAPEFEAEVGNIDVGEKDVTVTVPTVDIDPPSDESVASN
ncbi:MAG: hypothetical protein AAFW87_01865 [Pseudomonadota bacterium]